MTATIVALGPGGGRARDVDRRLGARLRERRITLGLTQQQVAERIGGAAQQVHKYETGVSRLSAGRLYQLAELLEVRVGYFYEGLEPGPDAVRAPAPPERQRVLLGLARDFARLPDRGQREALCVLAGALTGAEVR